MSATFRKEDIMKYGYYDDSHNYVIVLDEEKLKEIFEADTILFEEPYRIN